MENFYIKRAAVVYTRQNKIRRTVTFDETENRPVPNSSSSSLKRRPTRGGKKAAAPKPSVAKTVRTRGQRTALKDSTNQPEKKEEQKDEKKSLSVVDSEKTVSEEVVVEPQRLRKWISKLKKDEEFQICTVPQTPIYMRSHRPLPVFEPLSDSSRLLDVSLSSLPSPIPCSSRPPRRTIS